MNTVKYNATRDVLKYVSDLKISSDAVAKLQLALNCLSLAIAESAHTNAIANHRKTILATDIDCALDALYNYSEAWDRIFEDKMIVQDNSHISPIY